MTIGEQVMVIGKQKKNSPGELGKQIDTSGDIIGRNALDVITITPSIDILINNQYTESFH